MEVTETINDCNGDEHTLLSSSSSSSYTLQKSHKTIIPSKQLFYATYPATNCKAPPSSSDSLFSDEQLKNAIHINVQREEKEEKEQIDEEQEENQQQRSIDANLSTTSSSSSSLSSSHDNIPHVSRVIYCTDTCDYLQSITSFPPHLSIITSMPDLCETQLSLNEWKQWYYTLAKLLMSKLHEDYIKRDGIQISKSYLIQKAAEDLSHDNNNNNNTNNNDNNNNNMTIHCLFHKICIVNDINTVRCSAASYAHVLAFSKSSRINNKKTNIDSSPDIIYNNNSNSNKKDNKNKKNDNDKLWARGMGLFCIEYCVKYILKYTYNTCTTILDPFNGYGSTCIVSNYYGLHSIGIEYSKQRCMKAMKYNLYEMRKNNNNNNNSNNNNNNKKKKKKDMMNINNKNRQSTPSPPPP